MNWTPTALITLLPLTAAANATEKTDATDATQSLASPLSPGTGATISVGRSKTGIAAGYTQPIANSGTLQIVLDGRVQDATTFTAFSSSEGIGNGLSTKIGIGWSSRNSRRVREYERLCGEAQKIFEKHEEAEKKAKEKSDDPEKSCKESVLEIHFEAHSITDPTDKAAQKTALDAERKSCRSLAKDVEAQLPPSNSIRLQALIQEAGKKLIEDTPTSTTSSTTKLNCGALAKEQNLPTDVQEALSRWRKEEPPVLVRATLNYTPSFSTQPYHPASGDTYDLTVTEKYARPLHGVSIDGSLTGAKVALGAQVGYQQTISQKPYNVCKTTSQGDFEYQACSPALLGKPSPANSAFATVALAVPLTKVNFSSKVSPGFQVTGRLETTSSADARIFEKGTFRYLLSVPLFLGQSGTSSGLRAGISPQLGGPIGAKTPEFRLLLFASLAFPGKT